MVTGIPASKITARSRLSKYHPIMPAGKAVNNHPGVLKRQRHDSHCH
jgi:hypothetical protein